MNTALKYTKIDFTLVKKQIYIMFIVFAAISMIFIAKNEFGFFATAYISFGAIVLSAIPFNIENTSDSGFLDMLPSKTSHRILGRFFYSLSLCIFALFVEIIEVFAGIKFFAIENGNFVCMLMMIFSAAVILSSLQNLAFYLLGRNNNRQLMSIVSLIPGFAFIFGGSAIIDTIQENINQFINIVNYFYNNIELLAAISVLISAIVFICCVCVSSIVVERRGKL